MARIFATARLDEETLTWMDEQHEVTYESWQDTGEFPTGRRLVERLNEGAYEIYINEGDRVDRDVLENLTVTRLICVARGTPSNVDVSAATEAGILVTNAPGRNATAVAEYTVGLMLDLIRNITRSTRMVMAGEEVFESYEELEGIELNGRTVGIVGVGRIGREVAQRLQCFNVRVLGHDPYVDPDLARSVGVGLVPLEQLMTESDIVSIHAAVTPGTEGMIGAREIGLMKPTAYFVNTARAVITDEAALYEALRERRIAGAALDVFVDEPLTREEPLAALDNVLATPHLGGATREVVENHSRMIRANIEAYLRGRCPPNAVNAQAFSG